MSSESSFFEARGRASDAHSDRSDDTTRAPIPSSVPDSLDSSSTSVEIPIVDVSSAAVSEASTPVQTDVDVASADTSSVGVDSTSERSGAVSPSEATTLAIEPNADGIAVHHPSEQGGSDETGTVVASDAQGDPSDSNALHPRSDDGLVVGKMFAQFRIVRFVGGGGMGHVYEAFDCDLERTVAIKVLPKKRAQDEGVVARFLNEAKSSARLNHENIAQVYLFGKVSGIPYIAFEYVDGVNLRDYVHNNGVLELSEAIDYILQTASALQHAASHGVTHRDVKPSNILVTPQKRVKLIDMGLARLLHPKSDDENDLTESGMTLGTFDYISPEQAQDPRLADVRSDIYSLGCTFYFILTGLPPFPNGTMLQKLLQHQGNEAPDVRESNPSIPVEIATVIKKMMCKNPADRYQTPELLIKDLLQIVEMLGLNVADRGYKETSKTSTTIPPKAIPAALAITLFLACFVGFFLMNNSSDLTLPVVITPPVAPTSGQNAVNSGVEAEGNTSDSAHEGTGGRASAEQASSGGIDGGDAQRVQLGSIYASEGFDSLYAASYGASLEKVPLLLVDDVREELRSYLSAASSVAESKRVAFGWRAASLTAASDGVETSEFEPPLSFAVNAPEAKSDADALFHSTSYTVYTLPGSATDLPSGTSGTTEVVGVVDGRGDAPNTYATLSAALSASNRDADSVVRIELKFNDSLETTPVSLIQKKVELRAAEGYRPTLVFKPSETTDGGWGQRMFLLDSSSLTLRGIDLEFTVPSQEVVSSEWSVFEGTGASELTLGDSVVTVCNMTGSVFTSPLHSNVAFFRASDDSLLNSVFDAGDYGSLQSDVPRVFNVRLEHVLTRGEATLFNIEKAGGKYEAINSAFNISGPFLHYTESDNSISDSALRFSLAFDHVVATGRSGLLRIDSELSSDFSRTGDYVPDVLRNSEYPEFGQEIKFAITRRLPHFEVRLVDSILSLNRQSLASATSPAVVDIESFENEWTLDRLVTLDVSSFWRRRSSRAESWQEYAFDPARYRSEGASLASLNKDASERLESIPPHLFSSSDFSNWILTPIYTSSSLSEASRDVSDSIRNVLTGQLTD